MTNLSYEHPPAPRHILLLTPCTHPDHRSQEDLFSGQTEQASVTDMSDEQLFVVQLIRPKTRAMQDYIVDVRTPFVELSMECNGFSFVDNRIYHYGIRHANSNRLMERAPSWISAKL